MSCTDDLLALFGNSVKQGGARLRDHAAYANEHHDAERLTATRPTVVALVSVNGGVGRSTLTTALSSGLQRLGQSVVALDLDPQNALRQHFGVDHGLPGIGRSSLLNTPWKRILQSGFAGCQVIPFGETNLQQKQNLQGWLMREPKWLAQHLSALGLGEEQIVIVDTPAGDNVYLRQALSVADIVLVVAQPNAACLGTFGQVDALLAPHLARERPPRCHVVINNLDESSAFSLDMLDAFKLRRAEYPLKVVRRDPALSEGLTVSTDPLNGAARAAADDINDICRWLIARKKRL
ncbi:cell division protein FtsQ [Pseudomonas fluorescens ABAC62]|nr:cell division protein FtsQ [Pseudomonas fluorescens ABAC62]